MSAQPKATYAGDAGRWKGAIKVGRKKVWTCPHAHANRDMSSYSRGPSAKACASMALWAATDPEGFSTPIYRTSQTRNGQALRKFAAAVADDVRDAIAKATGEEA